MALTAKMSGYVDGSQSLLLTDLYEINMLQAYLDAGMTKPAAFEFFVRKIPENRNFLVAAGLEQVVDFLQDVRLSDAERQWLEATGRFSEETLNYLGNLRFSGDLVAMPEGTVFYPDEPILRVVAPLPEAQLFESRIINLLHFQTVIATKAARMAAVANGRTLIDFGLRRAHGAEAGLLAARASYLTGFDGTATMLAGARFGIPIYGTMAHSFIQAFDDEVDAFRAFAKSRPDNLVLLLDTYDTEAAARKVVAMAAKLKEEGIAIGGIRLDSGDLASHAKQVRHILDEGGLRDAKIFASGGLDETAIDDLLRDAAPIDGFGVGTALTTSTDEPCLDCAYKLTEYDGRSKRKESEGKATWPGRKQVFRRYDADGRMTDDLVTLEGEDNPGQPLLEPVILQGRLCREMPSLSDIRAHAADQLRCLPLGLSQLTGAKPYRVTISSSLRAITAQMDMKRRAAGYCVSSSSS